MAQDGYLSVTLLPDAPYIGIPYQVIAIRRTGPAQTIQRIRVTSASNKTTELGIDEAIQMVLSGRFSFFTNVAGFARVAVIVDEVKVDEKPTGRKFLRTDADQTTGNNLAALPHF